MQDSARWGPVSPKVPLRLRCAPPPGKPYRFGYASFIEPGIVTSDLLKHNLRSGEALHRDDAGLDYQEAVFVPASSSTAEGDGWLMAYAHSRSRNAADVVILHAQDFLGFPVATIELPTRVPFGIHGNWCPSD